MDEAQYTKTSRNAPFIQQSHYGEQRKRALGIQGGEDFIRV